MNEPATQVPQVRILAIGGARDGVGKSVFTVNAALSFLKETRARVLVVDADQEGCGDLGLLLGLNPIQTVAGMLPEMDRLGTPGISKRITVHPTGLGFLPIGANSEEAGAVGPEAMKKTLDLVKPLCDYILIDCGVGVTPLSVYNFECSSGIFLLATPDVLLLNHTRRMVEKLQGLHFPAQLIKVILNMYHPTSGIPVEVVSQTLQRSVLVTLIRDD